MLMHMSRPESLPIPALEPAEPAPPAEGHFVRDHRPLAARVVLAHVIGEALLALEDLGADGALEELPRHHLLNVPEPGGLVVEGAAAAVAQALEGADGAAGLAGLLAVGFDEALEEGDVF